MGKNLKRSPLRRLPFLLVAIGVLAIASLVGSGGTERTELSLDRVEALISEGAVVDVVIRSDADVIQGTLEPDVLPDGATLFTATYTDGFEG